MKMRNYNSMDKFYYEQSFSKIFIAINFLLLLSIFLIGLFWYKMLAFFLAVVLFSFNCIVIYKCVQMLYKRVYGQRYDYHQMESLFSIHQLIEPKIPLPPMRGFAGSPDFIKSLLFHLMKHQPKLIVEASSGVSSIVISEWITKYSPESKHYALDHEEKYAGLTRSRISQPNSTIIHAPLKSYSLDNKEYKWYDMSMIEDLDQIDMLIIDGPPHFVNDLARYPALPLLKDKLKEGCIIILDDGRREFEQQIVKEWAQKENISVNYLDHLEKGAFVLEFTKS